ncbi:MAG: hypothetical protein J0L97_02730 [Alphaproteobacteria bacterium]|nr:hypothetical protein [Alphaproteobacteria bacterium]
MRLLFILPFLLAATAHAEGITQDMPVGSVTDKSRIPIADAPARAVALTFCAFQIDALARLGGGDSKLPEDTQDVYVIAEKLMPEGSFEKLSKELETMVKESDVFSEFGPDKLVTQHEDCEKKALAIAKPYDSFTPAPKKP